RLVGEGLHQSLGLLPAQFGQRRAGQGGVEDLADVRFALSVPHEVQPHASSPFRTASTQASAATKSSLPAPGSIVAVTPSARGWEPRNRTDIDRLRMAANASAIRGSVTWPSKSMKNR